MGLLDILNSIQSVDNNPRTRPAARSQGKNQGMSPMAKAILALLAIFAMKNMRRDQTAGRSTGGGLGALVGGLMQEEPTVITGGLAGLLKQMQESGKGDVAQSWISDGPHRSISESDLASALGSVTLRTLSERSGMPRGDLLTGLTQYLPDLVDQLAHEKSLWARGMPEDFAERVHPSCANSYVLQALAEFLYEHREQIDLILLTGDLADDGDPRNLEEALSFIFTDATHEWKVTTASGYQPTLNCNCGVPPIFLMPGNHDRFMGAGRLPGGTAFDTTFKPYWSARDLAVCSPFFCRKINRS
jgi:uncharacterized protein YidB (DUF937 family)